MHPRVSQCIPGCPNASKGVPMHPRVSHAVLMRPHRMVCAPCRDIRSKQGIRSLSTPGTHHQQVNIMPGRAGGVSSPPPPPRHLPNRHAACPMLPLPRTWQARACSEATPRHAMPSHHICLQASRPVPAWRPSGPSPGPSRGPSPTPGRESGRGPSRGPSPSPGRDDSPGRGRGPSSARPATVQHARRVLSSRASPRQASLSASGSGAGPAGPGSGPGPRPRPGPGATSTPPSRRSVSAQLSAAVAFMLRTPDNPPLLLGR
jgi:hypothetical protein